MLDPVTVEVIRHRLDGIANEMEATLVRSAFSTIVKEAGDASASLFTAAGETLAQAVAQPVHLTTLIPMMRAVLAKHPAERMHDGDAFVLNDPYVAGGTHIPDIAVIMPIFAAGRVLAFAATLAHHQDTGGMTVGSTPTNATEIFQEGIRIPVLKLMESGRLNDTFVAMMRLNVRLPDTLMGDINAQIAACRTGARRLGELAGAYGVADLHAAFDDLLRRSEQLTRRAIEAIPDGTYRYTDYLDNDGVDLDRPIRIEVAITVAGDRVVCDLAGSSRQVRGPFNCMPSGALCAACFVVRIIGGDEIPTNGGCFRPIELRLPEASIVNPVAPAPVGCRTATIKRLAGAMLGCLRDVLPDRIGADSGSQLLTVLMGGNLPGRGEYAVSVPLASGAGAAISSDGVSVIETDATNTLNLPIEALEFDAPLRVNHFGLAADSGGAGRFRGGLGCIQEFEVLEGSLTVTFRGERQVNPAAGVAGGLPGGKSRGIIRRADGSEEVIPSKAVTQLHQGDRLLAVTAGGGGYGDPRQRERSRVEQDLRDGRISARAAREVYGLRDDGSE